MRTFPPFWLHFTGCPYILGFNLKLFYLFLNPYMGLPHLTFLSCYTLTCPPVLSGQLISCSWMCQKQSVSLEGIVLLLWQLLNYGMICLCPLGKPLHYLYLNQLLKHIFFLWPLTSDADIWLIILSLYRLLMCFICILCLVWVFISLYSTLVHFSVF